MKRVRKSKKREENDENDSNDPFSIIHLELKVEILMKLPPKSIGRLGFVSRHWSSMIRSKDFTELYLTRSSTRPRLLFSVYRPNMQMQFFHSCSQEDPSSDHHKVSYTLNSDLKFSFSPPIRGLIFGRNGTKAMIGNPSTGQFVSLPRVKTSKKDILSIFGYDPVNDQYKVLCMTIPIQRRIPGMYDMMPWEEYHVPMSEEHQVFTLGPKQKWRMIKCKYPHGHYSGCVGICRNGVLYYLASYNNKRSLINFDLSSEEFSVTKLPEDDHIQEYGNLVNHTGKITIVSQSQTYNGPLYIWVLEDASKEEWSKVATVTNLFGKDEIVMFRGMLRTGEIILKPLPVPNPFFFLCYDINEKSTRKVVIEGIGDDSAASIQVFFDHVESPMFLPKVK
ncbi:F-box/kelch-repeat protein [Cardamine amara subsp. amara]|uniref:F-box/kelch-repeat protein n=1 Tax=Cardamine amara subsp. amara TaxID=228776 RepID=A0ABD1AZN2_CARAN